MKKIITLDWDEDRQDDCIRYDYWATDDDGGFLKLPQSADLWAEKIKTKWGENVEIRSFLNMPR